MDVNNPLHSMLLEDNPDDRHLRLPPLDLRADLTSLEFLGMASMDGVLHYYKDTFAGRDIYSHLIGSDDPVVKVLAPKSGRFAAAVVSTGALNLIGVICARLAVMLTESEELEYPFQELRPRKCTTKHKLEPGTFRPMGLFAETSTIATEDPSALFQSLSPQASQCAIEIYAAALEFITLHECAHVVNFHRRVISHHRLMWSLITAAERDGRIVNGKSSIHDSEVKLALLLEHHADYFALCAMLRGAPIRPILGDSGLRLAMPVFQDHFSTRLIGMLGAAAGMSFIMLSDSPWAAERINPKLKDQGHHPSPLTRLAVATRLLVGSTASPLTRVFVWPQRTFRRIDVILQVAEMRASFAAIAALHNDWRQSNVLSHPGKDWPDWLQKLFKTRSGSLNDDRWEGVSKELRDIDLTSRRYRKEFTRSQFFRPMLRSLTGSSVH